MDIKFTKMHGLGNDFVVIDAINQEIDLSQEEIRKIADRNFGVGCDQLLLVEAPHDAANDFRYRIFNADGGEVEQCGNGARCFAQFVFDQGLTDESRLAVETVTGQIALGIQSNDDVIVNMGAPIFNARAIPFSVGQAGDQTALIRAINVDGTLYDFAVLSMGNPHAVLPVYAIDEAPVETLGPKVESHPAFPNRVNVGFMQIINRHAIALRVYERGAGETLACGSGACAAAVAGIKDNQLDSPVTVRLRGGDIQIEWDGDDAPVMMTGPAYTVFEGTVDPDKLIKRPQL